MKYIQSIIRFNESSNTDDYYKQIGLFNLYQNNKSNFTSSEIRKISDLIIGVINKVIHQNDNKSLPEIQISNLSLSTESREKIIDFSTDDKFVAFQSRTNLNVNQKLISNFEKLSCSSIDLKSSKNRIRCNITKLEDDWFIITLILDPFLGKCSLTSMELTSWKCDQLEGLLEFLKVLLKE
jgi:hypothetical protein